MYKFESICLDLQFLKIDCFVILSKYLKMATKNCNHCEKTFASASSLSHHKRSHDQTTKDTCDLCGQFFRKNNLKRHNFGFKLQGNHNQIQK